MPIISKIMHEHRLLYMDHSGVITATDVADNYHQFRKMPGAHHVRFVLADLRHLEGLRAYFDGMTSVAHIIVADGEEMEEPWEIALVSDDTGQYPLLLDYASQVRRSGKLRCEVLPTLERALDWMGLAQDVLHDIETAKSGTVQSIDGTT
ncbi:hypothetical protein [Thalassococcus lentus]|uniref:Uncharacterized protein n=1 Tax=Thalassococcus lentus TaxID=1210524 RepID=A0ABT4XNG1_9RHOB|nr:hypothetical protein [Thalassococcus lentus]MDA7423489.1 hypothetical protein [Thalassococcus lentus]